MAKIDFKKKLKHLYQPSAKEVVVVDIPVMHFLMIDGEGDPSKAKEFQEAIEALFSTAYTIKFLVKKEENIETAKERAQRIAKSETTAQVRRKAGRRAQRWISKGTTKMLMARALRRMGKKMFIKMLTKLIIGSILVFFPYWLWSTFSVLRKK